VQTVISADGTALAFDRFGDGPPIIMVVGAFNDRSTTEPLARALAQRFTVFNFDRRGRGDSDDTAPYAVEREIEDLGALVAEAGGSAAVFGYSSGAVLALKAAGSGLAITKLALYEPPFRVDDSYPALPSDLLEQLAELVSVGRRGDAVELFQTKVVRIPEDIVVQMRHAPFRPHLEAIAHTAGLRGEHHRRPRAAHRDVGLDPDASACALRRTQPAVPADRGASGCGELAQRAVLRARRPNARH
jgi:alpha-beta hydrolase superfamily lysophospholipase